jgi:hypothetical protein
MQVVSSNGCYTNGGTQNFTTRRLNESLGVTVVEKTGDTKTGPMSVTHAPQLSCPTDCTFYPDTIDDISGTDRDVLAITIAQAESDGIDKLSGKSNLRVHVVGDCQTIEAASIVGAAMVRYEQRSGKRAYTYTHAWRDVPYSAWQGARVIASCETTQDINIARDELGYPSAEFTYMEHESRKVFKRDGIKVLPCPNQFNKEVTCDKCMACANIEMLQDKNLVIGIAGHGAVKKLRKQLESLQKV